MSVISWRILESNERRVLLGESRVCGGQLRKGTTNNKVSLAPEDMAHWTYCEYDFEGDGVIEFMTRYLCAMLQRDSK